MIHFLRKLWHGLASPADRPEDAVDRVLEGMRRRLTEARLQVAAARGAARQAGDSDRTAQVQALEAGLREMEQRVAAAMSRREELVAALQRAEAETTVQRALIEARRADDAAAFDALEAAVRSADALSSATRTVASLPQPETRQ